MSHSSPLDVTGKQASLVLNLAEAQVVEGTGELGDKELQRSVAEIFFGMLQDLGAVLGTGTDSPALRRLTVKFQSCHYVATIVGPMAYIVKCAHAEAFA